MFVEKDIYVHKVVHSKNILSLLSFIPAKKIGRWEKNKMARRRPMVDRRTREQNSHVTFLENWSLVGNMCDRNLEFAAQREVSLSKKISLDDRIRWPQDEKKNNTARKKKSHWWNVEKNVE